MAIDNNTHELIEQYLRGELEGRELSAFLDRLGSDAPFREEVELMGEIEQAIREKDVTGLRESLSQIISDNSETNRAFFGLAEEIDRISDFRLEEDEIDTLGSSLHRLHLKNHQRSSMETVHDLNKKEEEIIAETDSMLLSDEDELLFKEIEQAVGEKDITELRSNLETISRHIPSHNICAEQIEEYISGRMSEDEQALMKREAGTNRSLASDIELYREIDRAVGEEDIMELRSSMEAISRSEVSHSRTSAQIEKYLSGELDQGSMASFEEELAINPGLIRDVNLHRETEEAIEEKDIMELRASLSRIRERKESPQEKTKRGITLPSAHRLAWYAAAASVILVLSIAGFIRSRSYTSSDIYAQYYSPYKGSVMFRSAPAGELSIETEAMMHFNRENYDAALSLFKKILKRNENNPAVNFYSGTIYQDRKLYDKALSSYAKVTEHNDNLLVEQARWYIALCYLESDKRRRALEEFRKIALEGGYYTTRALEIIEKLE